MMAAKAILIAQNAGAEAMEDLVREELYFLVLHEIGHTLGLTHNMRSSSKPSAMPLRHYLEMLVHTFMSTMSREYINEKFWLSTIVIDTGDISPIDLHLGIDAKEWLYRTGLETTLAVLPRKLARRN